MGPLTLLALVGLAFGAGRAVGVPYAQAFFLTAAAVIVALYVGALAGVLWWTALAVHIAGVALLGREALRHARERPAVGISVPLGMLALLCAWFWAAHGADQYFLYDEYAHWGVFVKEMLALDGLWTAHTNSMHPRYPPGAPLWQYLFNAFLPPSEGRTYFAHFVLLLAPLLTLWSSVRWSQPFWITAILALVLIAITNFGLGVSTLYVDQTIGAWYLGTLVAAFAEEHLASRRVALYAAPLAVIALLKDAGLAFAASGALIIAAIYCRRLLIAERSGAARKAAVALVVLLAPTLSCVQIWSWNRDAVGAAGDVQSLHGYVSGVGGEIGGTESETEAEIGRRLTEVFLDQQISNGPVSWEYAEFSYEIRGQFTDSYRLTTFGLLVAFVLWWAAIAYGVLTGESRRQWLLVAGGVLATALVYLVGLHSSYRFTFGSRGLDLPSYVRYVHIVAFPMLLLSFCPLLPAFRETHDRAWRMRGWAVAQRAGIFAAAMIALYALETPYLQPILKPNPKVARRANVEPLLEPIRSSVGPSRLWVYFPGGEDSTFFGRMVQYLLVPTPTVVEDSERFLQGADAAGIAAAWRGFDYVWIAEIPSVEAGIGLARFSGGVARAGLYRVRSSIDGKVELVPLVEQDPAY